MKKVLISIFVFLIITSITSVSAKGCDAYEVSFDNLKVYNEISKSYNKTEYEDYYTDSDGNYFLLREFQKDRFVYIPVEYIHLDFTQDNLEDMIKKYGFPLSLEKDIMNDFAIFKDMKIMQPNEAAVFIENYNLICSTNSIQYSYNPSCTYRTYEYIVNGANSSWKTIKNGQNTINVLSSLANVAVSIFSLGNSTVATSFGIFSTGCSVLSAYKAFKNLSADVIITPNDGDFFQARLIFNKHTRYVQHKITDTSWEQVLVMTKARVTRIGQETYTVEDGTYSSERYTDLSYPSPHYTDYWNFATNFTGDTCGYEWVKFKCLNYTWEVRSY